MESTETINVLLDSISFILNRMDCSEAAQFNINIILDYCKIHLNILDNSKKNLLHSRDFSTETFNLESLIEATSSVIRKFNKVNYKNIVQTLIDKIKSQTEVLNVESDFVKCDSEKQEDCDKIKEEDEAFDCEELPHNDSDFHDDNEDDGVPEENNTEDVKNPVMINIAKNFRPENEKKERINGVAEDVEEKNRVQEIMDDHKLDITYKCPLCPVVFAGCFIVAMCDHMLKEHDIEVDPNSRICPLCQGSVNCVNQSRTEYYSQMRSHLDECHTQQEFKCKTCGNKFKNQNSLHNHVKKYHTNNPSMEKRSCEICGKSIGESYFEEHMRDHLNEKSIPCPEPGCGKMFSTKLRLRAHMIDVHKEKDKMCTMCDYTTNKMYNLKLHMRTHTDNKRYSCDQCGKKLTSKAGLNLHIQRTHESEKKFVCTYCGRAFNCQQSLKTHIAIHTESYKRRCDVCDLNFVQIVAYKNHMWKAHQVGDHKFECKQCDQKFLYLNKYNHHMLKEHKIGNYGGHCDICNINFLKKKVYKEHMMRKHNVPK